MRFLALLVVLMALCVDAYGQACPASCQTQITNLKNEVEALKKEVDARTPVLIAFPRNDGERSRSNMDPNSGGKKSHTYALAENLPTNYQSSGLLITFRGFTVFPADPNPSIPDNQTIFLPRSASREIAVGQHSAKLTLDGPGTTLTFECQCDVGRRYPTFEAVVLPSLGKRALK